MVCNSGRLHLEPCEDNSTADVFSTLLTPRRPQNSQNFAADMSTSALDRRQRLSLETIYNVPFFKGSSNWMAKNLLGNWELAPQWQLQSPEFYTPQSSGPTGDPNCAVVTANVPCTLGGGQDANQNGDAAPDRTIFNKSGVRERAAPLPHFVTLPLLQVTHAPQPTSLVMLR